MKAPYRIFYSPNVLKKWSQNGTKIYFGRFLVKKKAPAATPPAEKNGLWPIKCLYGSKNWPKFWPKFWGTVLGEFFVAIRPLPKKNLVGSLLPGGLPVVMAEINKNVKIGLKRVAVGAFGTSPGPKCTEKQDLQPRHGDIAPKPLKWGFKSDFFDRFFRIFWGLLTK